MASPCCLLPLWRWLIKLPSHAFQRELPAWTRFWEEKDSSVEAACWSRARQERGSPALRRNSPAPPAPVAKNACISLLKSLPTRSSATCAPLALTSNRRYKSAYCTSTPFGQPAPASKDTWLACKNLSNA